MLRCNVVAVARVVDDDVVVTHRSRRLLLLLTSSRFARGRIVTSRDPAYRSRAWSALGMAGTLYHSGYPPNRRSIYSFA